MNKKNTSNALKYKAVLNDQGLLNKTMDVLITLCPKTEAPIYSLGFQRWQRLNRNQAKALAIKYAFNTEAIKQALQTKTAKELLVNEI